ncbi:MAG: pyrroline-5-carboxylate reductase [Erysipelotrichaceae bacterium]|nr:pyrroline-5-carboxylate reductase [Erysipelotrichaceae bacterium]MDY5251511.1 pyrroline-5-carboxylate reductase [Erysipelotrichaceae bacterium]
MENLKVGFIGYGNMAQAMVQGLKAANAIEANAIYVSSAHYDQLTIKTIGMDVNPCKTNQEVAEKSDLIVLAVKPNLIEQVVEEIKGLVNNKIVVSVAAGYTYDKMKTIAKNMHCICTIPNLAVMAKEGIIICEDKHSLDVIQLATFKKLFSKIGSLEFVSAKNLSIAGTISGCAPAFTMMYVEALADAGVAYGLTREQAYRLASQMIVGAGKMQLATKLHPAQLKDMVCSPGGTTIKGVNALNKEGFKGAIVKSIEAIEGK